MPAQTSLHELETLVRSFHPVLVVETVEEERAGELFAEVARRIRAPFYSWSLARGLIRHHHKDPIFGTKDPKGLLQNLADLPAPAVYLLLDFAPHLDDAGLARRFRELAQGFAKSGSTLVLSGETVKLPLELEHKALRCQLALPERDELHRVVRATLESLRARATVQVDITKPDYDAILTALRGLTLEQARRAIAYAVLVDGRLDASDVQRLLERKARLLRDGGVLDYYPVEGNSYQLGGFARLKQWLERARTGFSAGAAKYNLRAPKGLLFVGVQGCGKSLAARCIARQWQLPLLKLDAGRLFDKFIGESEKNFRKACAIAESMAPVVLWIDEIEKAMPAVGSSGESDGGLSRRLFGAFLTWLQEKKAEVFVVATANDLWALPPELLRKGRFDEIFFVDLPDAAERREILTIHVSLRKLRPEDFELEQLVAASEGFSGAEIEQAVVAALYRALHLQRAPDTALLLEEIAGTVPLSASRREDLERLRATAQGRFVPVK